MTKTYNLSSFNYDKIKVNSSYGDRSEYFIDVYQEDHWKKKDGELPSLSIERIFLIEKSIQFDENSLLVNMGYRGGINKMRILKRDLFFYYTSWDKQLVIPGYFPRFNDRIMETFLSIFSSSNFRLLVKKINEYS